MAKMTLRGHKAEVQCLQRPFLLCCLLLINLLSGPGRGAQGQDRRRGQGCYQPPGLGHISEKGRSCLLDSFHNTVLGMPKHTFSSWEEKAKILKLKTEEESRVITDVAPKNAGRTSPPPEDVTSAPASDIVLGKKK